MSLAVQGTKLVHALKAETVDHDLLHLMVDSLARNYGFRTSSRNSKRTNVPCNIVKVKHFVPTELNIT